MTFDRTRRWYAVVGGVLILVVLLIGYQHAQPWFVAAVRVGTLSILFFSWRYCVEALVAGGVIHPMRRETALSFRWRFLTLVVLLEWLVIQQLPLLVVDAIRG